MSEPQGIKAELEYWTVKVGKRWAKVGVRHTLDCECGYRVWDHTGNQNLIDTHEC